MNQDKQEKDKEEQQGRGRSTAEITLTVICSLIVVFLVGYSIYHGIVAAGTPPRLSATPLLNQVEKRGDNYILPVEVRNRTRPTAEDVEVAIRYKASTGEVSDKQFRIAYLPEHSIQKGYAAFQEDPSKGTLEIEIESYKLP